MDKREPYHIASARNCLAGDDLETFLRAAEQEGHYVDRSSAPLEAQEPPLEASTPEERGGSSPGARYAYDASSSPGGRYAYEQPRGAREEAERVRAEWAARKAAKAEKGE